MTGARFVVLDKSAHMPASARGNYRRLGIVELRDPADPVHMLSTRDKNVLRIVETWEALNVGKTDRSAYRRALVEAEAKCAILNAAPCDCPRCKQLGIADLAGDIADRMNQGLGRGMLSS